MKILKNKKLKIFEKFNKLDFSNKEKRKKLVSLFVVFVGIIIMVGGTSFAFLNLRKSGSVNTITAGTLVVNLPKEGSSVKLLNAEPVPDSIGIDVPAYEFTIRNNGTISMYYEIRLNNSCVVGVAQTIDGTSVTPDECIPNTYIKVATKIGDGDYEITTIRENGTVASGYITPTKKDENIKLKVWLIDTTPNIYNSSNNNVVYSSNLQLYGRQLTEQEKLENDQFSEETVYEYDTDNYQIYTAPVTGYYQIEAWGASGGNATNATGGKGGYAKGTILLTKGEKLYITVGGTGSTATNATLNGGYNGGGSIVVIDQCNNSFGTGGGATDIRTDASSLLSRIMVAAGGAGAGYRYCSASDYTRYNGGIGGGLYGGNSILLENAWSYSLAQGGTQTSGGAGGTVNNEWGTADGTFGVGGSYFRDVTYVGQAGGGGGYYGGGLGLFSSGGGGSSFISGYAGVNAINSSSTLASISHSNNTKHYSNKYFVNTEMQSGNNTGNGKATIKYIGSSLTRTNTLLNNVRYIKDCMNGNNMDQIHNHWVEIQAIYQGNNVAKLYGSVTGPTTDPLIGSGSSGNWNTIIDGDTTTVWVAGSNPSGYQCVIIDLGEGPDLGGYNLDEIGVWHYWGDGRTYYDNITYVSSDGTNYVPVMNYGNVAETSQGKRVSAYTISS